MKIKHFVQNNLGKIVVIFLAAGAINWLLTEFVVKTPTVRQFEDSANSAKQTVDESAKTPTSSSSPLQDSALETQRRETKRLTERLNKIELKHKENQEKNEQIYQQRKACISEKQLADWNPNDKEVLSSECKKILAN
jgi:hypothetical protein